MLKTKVQHYFPLSCGIRLLGQLDAGKSDYPYKALEPEENALRVVHQVARKRYRQKPENWTWVDGPVVNNECFSQVIFSHRVRDEYCDALVDLIRKKRLGTLTKSPSVINSNSGARIHTYIWTLNEERLKDMWVARDKPRKRRQSEYNW